MEETNLRARHKVAAKKIGCTVETYIRQIEDGYQWCYIGQHWKKIDEMVKAKAGSGRRCKPCYASYTRDRRHESAGSSRDVP